MRQIVLIIAIIMMSFSSAIKSMEKEAPKGPICDLEIATTLSLALEKLPVIRSKPDQSIATFTEGVIPFILTRKNTIDSISLSAKKNEEIKSGIVDMIKIKNGHINLKRNRFEIAVERKMYNDGADELIATQKLIGILNKPLKRTMYHIGCDCDYCECEHYIILSILVKSPN